MNSPTLSSSAGFLSRGKKRAIYEPQNGPNVRHLKLSGDPNPSTFSKVLLYKWEACSRTNGRRCTAGFPFLQELEARKAQRYKLGGVLPYKLEMYCSTFLGTVGLSKQTKLNTVVHAQKIKKNRGSGIRG